MPSSSHASSNSLVATMPYQYWWPNSCSVTISVMYFVGSNQDVPAVMSVGYSMPSISEPGSGSMTVMIL
jgi:hypothetical protein